MPKLTSALPQYRHHKASGRAVVNLSGKDFYLGPWGTEASRKEYDRVIGEWLQNGRSLRGNGSSDITVVEILTAYLKHANAYYVKDGQRTREAEIIEEVLVRFIQPLYGRSLATDFGPCALKAIREKMIEAGHSRGVINKNIARIKRMFRWATAEELVPVSVYQSLATLSGLRKGRTEARETSPVLPVADEIVDATLKCLSPVVADMITLQRLTGCRPGEVRQLRPMDIDRTDEKMWIFRPNSHKTQHLERDRVIFIGPRAQPVLLPYLQRDAQAYCFSPADSEARRRVALRAERKTPVQPSQQDRSLARPQRKPGNCYTKDSYNKAIQRGCELAFNMPKELRRISTKLPSEERSQLQQLASEWRAENCWCPNRVRHTVGTELREKYGVEGAQVVLGHARADVTQVYAERNLRLARNIIDQVG